MSTQDFEHFIKSLERLNADLDDVARRVVNRAVNEGMAVTIKATPPRKDSKRIFSGTLKKGWIQNPAQRVLNGWEGGYSNNVEYGIYVNFGHRIVSKGKTIGYLPGQFFLEEGVNHARRNMEHYFRSEIKTIKGEW